MIYLRFIRSRRMWIVGTVVLAAGMALVLALVRSPNTVEAKSSYLSSMMNTYPALNNTKLDSCQTCHTNFGTMWMASLASPSPPMSV